MEKSIYKKFLFKLFALGVINALPFIFEKLSFISWFSFVPFFVILTRISNLKVSNKKIFACIFTFSIAYYFTIYHFFLALYPLSFAGIGKISSLFIIALGWIMLSAFHAIELSLGTYIAIKIKSNLTLKILSLSFAILLVEYIQYIGPFSFPWARISLPQYNLLPLIQSASLFGPYFIDLLILLTNAFLALVVLANKKRLYLFLSALVFLINYLFGIHHINTNSNTISKADVSLIQGNVLVNDKWNGSSSYSTYLNMTKSIDKSSDIVLWSETAIPLELNESKKIPNDLTSYCKNTNTEMLVGAFYRNYYNKELNGAYYISENGVSDKVYFKRKLVPFGEYLPFRKLLELFPFLSDINLYTSDLYPGKSSEVFTTKKGKVGCLICFDSIFHSLSRESVNNGAELIAVMTNDAWYKDFPAVYQHNAQSVWRAVENNRWVVRCANSGISSVISNNGKIVSRIPPLRQGTITETVYFIADKTLYSVIGDIVIIVPTIYFIILLFLNKKCFCKSKNTN